MPVGTILEGSYYRCYPDEPKALLGEIAAFETCIHLNKDDYECVKGPSKTDRLKQRVKELESQLERIKAEPMTITLKTSPEYWTWGTKMPSDEPFGEVQPKPQYRMVEPGEVIQEGDEWISIKGWIKTERVGFKVCQEMTGEYRRRLE